MCWLPQLVEVYEASLKAEPNSVAARANKQTRHNLKRRNRNLATAGVDGLPRAVADMFNESTIPCDECDSVFGATVADSSTDLFTQHADFCGGTELAPRKPIQASPSTKRHAQMAQVADNDVVFGDSLSLGSNDLSLGHKMKEQIGTADFLQGSPLSARDSSEVAQQLPEEPEPQPESHPKMKLQPQPEIADFFDFETQEKALAQEEPTLVTQEEFAVLKVQLKSMAKELVRLQTQVQSLSLRPAIPAVSPDVRAAASGLRDILMASPGSTPRATKVITTPRLRAAKVNTTPRAAKVSSRLPRPMAQVPRASPRSAAKGRAQRMAAPSEGPPGSEISIFLDGGVEAMRAEGHRRAHAHAPLRSRNGNVVGASPAGAWMKAHMGALSALLAEVRLAPTTAKAVATLPGYIELEDFLEADKVELEEIIAKTGMERPEARRFLKAIAAKKKSV